MTRCSVKEMVSREVDEIMPPMKTIFGSLAHASAIDSSSVFVSLILRTYCIHMNAFM